ncbi:MAG: hypothetical protein NVS3B3_03370 [Aquirhabdus sp.]
MHDEATYEQAKTFVLNSNTAGISIIQRQFRMGYSLAKDIIERMEAEGVISPPLADGTRQVFEKITNPPMNDSAMDALPVNSLICKENRNGGLMLCGINHGYTKQDELLDAAGIDRSDSHRSFFSDKSVNDYRMRNRIVEWFRLWGYSLASTKETAAAFEKSIIQTNWLQSCTNNVKKLNIRAACIADCESFLHTCDTLTPKVLVFFSKELLLAFTSQELSARVQAIFGVQVKDTQWLQSSVIENGKSLKAFKVGIIEYERLKIVSLPHPTGSKGLADSYIAAFRPQIAEIIDPWWGHHQQKLGDARYR